MSDFSEYPQKCTILGETYQLVEENRWLRKFIAKSGKFHVVSRLRDGSTSFDILEKVHPDSLAKSERYQAVLDVKVTGVKDLPSSWKAAVDERE